MVGHVQAVGDALEDLGVADLADAVDDFADPALAQADRSADAHLAEPEVLPQQPEQRAHVALRAGPGRRRGVPRRRPVSPEGRMRLDA